MDLESKYVSHAKKCVENAEARISKLSQEILDMDGLSGYSTRHLYNNLLDIEDARYLEIGTWKGSSVCSAMFGHSAKVVCIDNWSELGAPKSEFLVNFDKFKGANDATFMECDCFTLDVSTLPKFNLYMYDGNHEEACHYKAIDHYYDCLDDVFIFVVDDWNWNFVRKGTMDAIRDRKLEILYNHNVRTTNDNSHPKWGVPLQKQWHNGMFIAVLKKTNSQ